MRNRQPIGALLVIAGVVLLYLLRGPLVKIILTLLEFLAIVVAIVLLVVGIVLVVGGRVGRGFWMRT